MNILKILRHGFGIVAVFVMCSVVFAQDTDTDTLNRVVVRVDSLSCGGCFPTIRSGLETLKGFDGMGTNLFRKLIGVDFTSPLTQDDILSKMASVGYPGVLESVGEITKKESFSHLESKRGRNGPGGSCCGSRSSCSAPSINSTSEKI